jgi:hypothetical protein
MNDNEIVTCFVHNVSAEMVGVVMQRLAGARGVSWRKAMSSFSPEEQAKLQREFREALAKRDAMAVAR